MGYSDLKNLDIEFPHNIAWIEPFDSLFRFLVITPNTLIDQKIWLSARFCPSAELVTDQLILKKYPQTRFVVRFREIEVQSWKIIEIGETKNEIFHNNLKAA